MEVQMRTGLLGLFAGAALLACAASAPATAAGPSGLRQAAVAPDGIVTRVGGYYHRRAYGCCGPRYRHYRPATYGYYRPPAYGYYRPRTYGYYRPPAYYAPAPATVVYYPPPVVYYPPPVVTYAYAPVVAPYRAYGYGPGPYTNYRYRGDYYGW